jgi:hypothetical protein
MRKANEVVPLAGQVLINARKLVVIVRLRDLPGVDWVRLTPDLVVVYARRMPDTKDYQPWHRYRDAMTASAKLR